MLLLFGGVCLFVRCVLRVVRWSAADCLLHCLLLVICCFCCLFVVRCLWFVVRDLLSAVCDVLFV